MRINQPDYRNKLIKWISAFLLSFVILALETLLFFFTQTASITLRPLIPRTHQLFLKLSEVELRFSMLSTLNVIANVM